MKRRNQNEKPKKTNYQRVPRVEKLLRHRFGRQNLLGKNLYGIFVESRRIE
jgi:hypothetical protein